MSRPVDLEPRLREDMAFEWARGLGKTRLQGASPLPRSRVEELHGSLGRAIRQLRRHPPKGHLATAAEWMLDNEWLVRRSLDLIQESLPVGFCRRLPATDSGLARVELLAREIVARQKSWLEALDLAQWVAGVGRVEEMTIGELWALPAMVRWALVEDLTAAVAAAADLQSPPPPRGEARGHPPDPMRVSACVQSLRALEHHDWRDFLESTSQVEAELRRDPAAAYPQMDFATRDRYRKAVESVARRSRLPETEIAKTALRLATHAAGPAQRHVGYWLVGEGHERLMQEAGSQPSAVARVGAHLKRYRAMVFIAAQLVAAAPLVLLFTMPAHDVGGWKLALAVGLSLLPASALAVPGIHWLATGIVRPRVLPKLEFEDGTPSDAVTLIVVPAMLGDAEEVDSVLKRAETNWLSNANSVLGVALLFDYADAARKTMRADAEQREHASEGVRRLNLKHDQDGNQGPFLLLLRRRRWSETEQQWMGWERKRGKLEQFNRLALGEESQLWVEVGDASLPGRARFALTLAADTILPPQSARRLIGTLAHPLNRPVFSPEGKVVAGYTVLQPRVDIAPWSRKETLFSRVFSGERGLDLYSRAVSDVYQDLFAEGIYVGKGLYDIAAFHRSLRGRVPEGALLSHDLFEGLHGRAALVSDAAVLEEFPSHPLSWVRRRHRWIRGDWQISPWLLSRVPGTDAKSLANRLSLLGRWQILDNLRRSLVTPGLLALLIAGWTVLPGSAWWWTGIAAAVPGVAFALGTLAAARARLRRGRSVGTPREWTLARIELARWGLALVLIPFQARIDLDAVARAGLRMWITRRRLLEWTTASKTERLAHQRHGVWREMKLTLGLTVGLSALIATFFPSRLVAAAPLLLAWFASPFVVSWMARPILAAKQELSVEDRRFLRQVARRTWSFFEYTLGPDDHWLPPDHLQEAPRLHLARRTSPTNIGLAANAMLAAWDFGYLSSARLAASIDNLFDTLDGLERFRGHFLNWYDTHRLTPLAPRYVSTVDSGNLACALITLARGLENVIEQPLPRLDSEPLGLLDVLGTVKGALERRGWEDVDTGPLVSALADAAHNIEACPSTARSWRRSLDRLIEGHLPAIEALALDLAESSRSKLDPRELQDLRERLLDLRHQAETLREEASILLPWLDLPQELSRSIPETGVSLAAIPGVCAALRHRLAELDKEDAEDAALRLDEAESGARHLLAQLTGLAKRADRYGNEMDFTFLYDAKRHLLRIGYDVDSGRDDPSRYDLFASEARTASYFAIATGALPAEHWVHLGRPFTRSGGHAAMLSWAGTLFEYLMPDLFMSSPRGSLLELTTQRALDRHMAFGKRHHLPWGISESGYHELDDEGGYRYRAFGVPDLSLRRDLEQRAVIAPYASSLAASMRSQDVVENLRRLRDLGALGPYGLYEAVDFGKLTELRSRGRIVRSYMAHHQAMILLAFGNALHGEKMVRRFLSDSRMSAASHLLYENTPERVPIRSSYPAQPVAAPTRELKPVHAGQWGYSELAPRPRVQVLSNGRWSTLISDRGSGGARVAGLSLTRWRADPTVDVHGVFIYLQDLDSAALWSASAQPTRPLPQVYETLFTPHAVEFHRHQDQIFSRLIVCVTVDADIELRQLYLRNDSDRRRHLGITSFGEVALARQNEDRRHPAFSKLFVESRFDVAEGVLFFRRRGAAGATGRLGHAVMLTEPAELVGWESDRGRFLGRGGSPAYPLGLKRGPAGLSRGQGSTLDPAFALGCQLELLPGEATTISFLTGFGDTEAEILSMMDGLRSPERVEWAFEHARGEAAIQLARGGLEGGDARRAQALMSTLVYPRAQLRCRPSPEARRPRQAELWAIGVSGDFPLLLLRMARPEDKAEALRVLRAHSWLRGRQVGVDLVVVDAGTGGYADPVHGWLQEAVAITHDSGALGRRGGVHYVPFGRLDPSALASIEAAAAVILDTATGGLTIDLEDRVTPHLPPFVPLPMRLPTRETPPLPPLGELSCRHARGGLAPDGASYRLRIEAGAETPAPWCHVVADPDFGFLTTESGGGGTFSLNSSERRLTPWSNDPVLDTCGETVHLRDEETGHIWSATPQPAGGGQPYNVRYEAGKAQFEHHRFGLAQRLSLFTTPGAAVKISRLELENLWQHPRRLTVTCFVEWTLGNHRDVTAPHILTELVEDPEAILAFQRFSQEHPGRVAFLAASEPLHGLTADRGEFLGSAGHGRPAGLDRIGLSGTVGAGLDPCTALQVHIDLAAGEARSLHFLLGDGENRAAALQLVREWRAPSAARKAEADRLAGWRKRLARLSIRTPEPAMDALLNYWLPYQTLACRLWGRTAFYQSSGAFGFRDQLQDSLAFLTTDPSITRRQILECARHQFAEGDVLHWWHPPAASGTRTRCSDDLLWLPFAIAAYLEATGDRTILALDIPFLAGEELSPREHERYQSWPEGPAASLYEHGARALEKAWTSGPHDLPLIGGGDWNDGMDRVGLGGRGESVWLGWFLLATARAWAPICQTVEGAEAAERLRQRAEELKAAMEKHAWDGEWYRRAFYDDGTPLGTAGAPEAEIDSISQSWAVLSAAGEPERARRALASALEHLVHEPDRLVLLLTPPFDRTRNSSGYIKSYPPGVRENGGQYTHAAVWLAWAFAELGEGEQCQALFSLLNPLLRAETEQQVERYRVEPYVVAADIYGAPPHVGRGGWTWYTGAAGWLWRLGIEAILGIRRQRGQILVDPCIPPSWPGFEATIRLEGVEATIRVENPDRVSRGVVAAVLDGRPAQSATIALDAPGHHELSVRLGQKRDGENARRS